MGAASSRTAHGKGKRKQRIKGKRNDDVQKVEDRNYELQFMTTSQVIINRIHVIPMSYIVT